MNFFFKWLSIKNTYANKSDDLFFFFNFDYVGTGDLEEG